MKSAKYSPPKVPDSVLLPVEARKLVHAVPPRGGNVAVWQLFLKLTHASYMWADW